MSRRLGSVALALGGGLALAFGLAEAGLRLADRAGWVDYWADVRQARTASIWTASEDPALLYVNRPGYVVHGERYTEAHGILRPDDVAVSKPPGVWRVAAIGDSVTAAIDLHYGERFPDRLEALLATPERPVEVLNFGVNGYDTLQEAELLERHAARFAPDLVLLQYCGNDLHTSEYPAGWFEPVSPSYALAFLRYQLERRTHIGYAWAGYWERSYREDREGWAGVERGFGRIAAWARERDAAVVLAVVPILQQEGWWAGAAEARQARVVAAGERAGFTVVDLLPVLAAQPVDSLRLHPWDTFHLNPKGHGIVAEALASALRARGWPPSPSAPGVGQVLGDHP